MKSLKLAEKRHSVRDYKNKKLNSDDLKTLSLLLLDAPELMNSSGVDFFFVEEGEIYAPLLERLAGYNGIMISAPHYYVLLSDAITNDYKAVGYIGEWFVLNALKQGIGSCWLEVKDSDKLKSILHIDSPKEAVALLAVGYAQKEHQYSNFFGKGNKESLFTLAEMGYPNINTDLSQGPTSYRKSITEFIYMNEWGNTPDVSDLEQIRLHEALFYMRLAPSYENRQPWMFVFREDHIDLAIEQHESISPIIRAVDAGIAMLYMEVGLHDTGIAGKWQLSVLEPPADIPDGYELVGQYNF